MSRSARQRLASGIGATALIASIAATGSYASLTLLAPLEPISASLEAQPVISSEQPELDLPTYGGSAIAAIGYPDAQITHGSPSPLELASITKVITSLVVLDAKPIRVGSNGPTLTFGAYDVERYRHHLYNNGSNKPVWSGLALSQRTVLEAVLMSSANNYAESLAVWAFGSIDAFVDRATRWLAVHGMHDTRVVEPSGIKHGNVSTTADLLILGRLALANPIISDIVAQSSRTVEGLGVLENSNRLIGQLGIDGIKTGRLEFHNLLFSADIDIGGHTVTVVGAVMGADDRGERDRSVRRLVQSMRDGFEERELVAAGTLIGTYTTQWGDTARAVTASSASALVWRGSETHTQVSVDDIDVGSATHLVGRLDVRVGARSVSVPIVLEGAIGDPGWWWRLVNPAALL